MCVCVCVYSHTRSHFGTKPSCLCRPSFVKLAIGETGMQASRAIVDFGEGRVVSEQTNTVIKNKNSENIANNSFETLVYRSGHRI